MTFGQHSLPWSYGCRRSSLEPPTGPGHFPFAVVVVPPPAAWRLLYSAGVSLSSPFIHIPRLAALEILIGQKGVAGGRVQNDAYFARFSTSR